MRGPHDVGGKAAGPVDRSEHRLSEWEERGHAISSLLRNPALGRAIGREGEALAGLDEQRRHTESLGERYYVLSYGERTLHALVEMLLRRGVVTVEELAARIRSRG
jgi:hypothetical protein